MNANLPGAEGTSCASGKPVMVGIPGGGPINVASAMDATAQEKT